MQNRFSKYAQPSDPITKQADPTLGSKVVEAANNAEASQYAPTIQAGEAAKTPFEVEQARLQNENLRLQMDLDRKRGEREAKNKEFRPIPDAAAKRFEDKVTAFAGFKTAVGGFNDDYSGLGAGIENTAQSILGVGTPGQRDWWAGFKQNDAALRNAMFGASLTPGEQAAFAETTISPSMDPAIIRANLKRREDMARKALDRSANYLGANGADPTVVQALMGEYSPNALEAATQNGQYFAAPKVEAATGGMTTEMDPQMASAVERMIRAKRPVNEITAYAQSKGGNVIDPAMIGKAQQYLTDNPGYKGSFVSATKERPTTAMENLAASPLSAFVNGAGTAVTAGFNDELVGAGTALLGGDYEQGRDAFNAKKFLVSDENPKSDFAGNVLGSALSMGALGAGAGTLAANGSRTGGLLMRGGGLGADAAYGALYGAGQNNENRMGGAILGGAAGGLGNIAGQGLATGVAGAIAPNGGRMANMYALGSRPSIGQRIGGVVNRAEEKLQSLPIVGDAIRGTRDRARDQAERGIFNEALGQVGEQLPEAIDLGPDAHTYKQAVENRVYSQARAGMTFVPDGQFGQDVGQLQRQVGTLTEQSQTRFGRIWEDSVVRRLRNNGGQLTGDAYKDAHSDIGDAIRGIRKSANGDGELADALEAMQGTLDGAARRNSPPEANALMDQADAMYARGVLIDRASSLAGGEPGRMSPSQYLRAVKGEGGGVRGRQFNAGNALNQDLATSFAQLGDAVPNSGTFDRLAMGAAAGGAGFLEPGTLTALGGLGLLNAPGVRNLTTGLMAPRGGPLAQGAANQVRRLRGPFASLGAGSGIALTSPR